MQTNVNESSWIIAAKHREFHQPFEELFRQKFLETLESVSLSNYDGTNCPEHLKTEIRSCWTGTNMYFIFEGSYQELVSAPVQTPTDQNGKTMNLWEISDVYEIFLGPEAKKTGLYKEFQVGPDNRWIDIDIDNRGSQRQSDFEWTSGFRTLSKINTDQKQWKASFIIPFAAFGAKPQPDTVWNVNFYRISGIEPDKHYLTWTPVDRIDFHQHLKFGKILFMDH